MPVGTSATSLLINGAILPDDVQGPPPSPLETPEFTILVMLGPAEFRSSNFDQFQPSSYQLEVIGPWPNRQVKGVSRGGGGGVVRHHLARLYRWTAVKSRKLQ